MDVAVVGPGAGGVASISETTFSGFPIGPAVTVPGEINCDKAGGPVCAISVAAAFGSEALVTLTATPAPGKEFVRWEQQGASGVVSPPGCEADTSCVLELNGSPGPAVTISASFTCAPPVAAPRVTTGGVRAGDDFALRTLEGTIDPEGCGVEEGFFEYGPTAAYGLKARASDPGEGASPQVVRASTEPLEPNTTYHYRLVAIGPGGTSRGEDRTFTTGPAPLGTCPNEARRLEQGIISLLLPDCMALEMVSPPSKAGQPAANPSISLDGQRVSFTSVAALGENPPPALKIAGSVYVAGRGDSGWSTSRTLPDAGLDVLWTTGSEARASLTPDFSRSLGIGATSAQMQRGIGRAFDAGLGGSFRWLSAPMVPFASGAEGTNRENVVKFAKFQAASADHSHLYFRSGRGGSGLKTTYFADDPTLSGPGAESDNTYLVRIGADGQPTPQPELLQRDRSRKVWGGECGARLGGIGSAANSTFPAPNGDRNQGAVSADGRTTYLSARADQPQSGPCEAQSKLRILQRLETPSGPQIFRLFVGSQCDRPATPDPPGPCKDLDGDDLYQGASLDQSKVYFTTNRQLADTDRDGTNAECDLHVAVAGCDLYLYDGDRPAGERLIQVSAGGAGDPTPGEEAKVYNGITAISADGRRAYFVAAGVLTDKPNPEGDVAEGGQPNLYVFDQRAWEAEGEEGGLAFIGRLDPGDGIAFSPEYSRGLWGGQGTWQNNAYPVPVLSDAERRGDGNGEEGGDGRILVLETHASLSRNDADGGHLDVYRYDSVGAALQCVSCRPGSSVSDPDAAPFDVQDRGESRPPETDFAERGRWVSDDGGEIVFATAEGLLPGDVNGVGDIYVWRPAGLYRLPASGVNVVASSGSKPVVSPDGSTLAFVTARALLPQDGDGASDVYVARAGGGFPNLLAPVPCDPGSDCQPAQAPPAAPGSASEAPTRGNVTPDPCAAPARQARKLSKRAQRLRKRARRAARHNPQRAKAHRRKAGRLGRRAHRLSQRAKRCRAGLPQSQRAEDKGRSARRSHHRRRAG